MHDHGRGGRIFLEPTEELVTVMGRRPTVADTQRLLAKADERGLPHMIFGSGTLFFGVAGSNNDINVLNQSTLFTEVARDNAPPVNFSVNGHDYNKGYYLADGIYPSWPVFMKGVPVPQHDKHIVSSRRSKHLGAKMLTVLLVY